MYVMIFCFSDRRRQSLFALVTGFQTFALPICRRGLDQTTNKSTSRATTAVADAHALMLGSRRHALRDDRAEREVAGRPAAVDGEARDRAVRIEDMERDALLPQACDADRKSVV